MNMTKCPECGGENPPSAVYCTICGNSLIAPQLDWRARTLFFATPPLLVFFCLSLAWDLGDPNWIESGAEWGLTLAFIYMIVGGFGWLFCRLLAPRFDPIDAWKAGMFSIIQLPLAFLISLPLQLLWLEKRFSDASFTAETHLKLVLIASIFVPLCFLGLFFLIRQAIRKTASPPAVGFRAENLLGPGVVLLVSILLFAGLYLALPAAKKNFLAAQVLASLGMRTDALTQIEAALELNKDDPTFLHYKGLLLISQDDLKSCEQAIPLLQKAIQTTPANPKFHLALSLAFERLGKNEEAIDAASRTLDLKPSEASLWVHFANLTGKFQQRKRSVAAYKKALSLEPGDPVIQNNMAYSMLEMNENIADALSLARDSVRRQPGTYNQDTLAWALYKNGQLGEAFEIMKEVKQEASGSPEIDFHYAVIANDLGIYTKPRLVFEELLSRPQVAADPFLRQQIEVALASSSYQEASSAEKVTPERPLIKPETASSSLLPNQPIASEGK